MKWLQNGGDGEKNGGTWKRMGGVVEGNEEGDMIKKMEELLRTDIEQTIQKDWVKIDNLTYCRYYRHLKTDLSGEEYLSNSTKDEEKKKLWARARCGNIWRGQDSRGVEGVDKRKKMPSMQKTIKSSKKGQG